VARAGGLSKIILVLNQHGKGLQGGDLRFHDPGGIELRVAPKRRFTEEKGGRVSSVSVSLAAPLEVTSAAPAPPP